MKKSSGILAILLVSGLFLGGCSGMLKSSAEKRKDALFDCNAQADREYKARYTGDWNNHVNRCMENRGFEGPY